MSRRSINPNSRRVLARQLERLVSHEEPARLARVNDAVDALKRMACGQYGVCVECEAPIPMARLRARPEAKRCVSCQSRQDAYLAA